MNTPWHPQLNRKFLIVAVLAFIIWGLTDIRYRAGLHPDEPWKHRTDFTVYTEAGAAFFDGRDPYEVANPRGWKYLYPPMLALTMAPLHPLPTVVQGLIWYALSLAMLWGCYRESVRLVQKFFSEGSLDLERVRPYLFWVGACAVGAILFPVLNCLQRGQVGIAQIYFLLLGFRWIWERRSPMWTVAGGVMLAVPVVLKVTPMLPVCFVLFHLLLLVWKQKNVQALRARFVNAAVGVTVGLALFFFIIPATLVGWQSNLDHLQDWFKKVGSQSVQFDQANSLDNPLNMKNQSLSNAVYRLGNFVAHVAFGGPPDKHVSFNTKDPMPMDAPWVQKIILLLRVAVVLLLFWVVLRLSDEDTVLNLTLVFGLACVVSLIVSPVSRGHYFMMQLPALLAVPFWLLSRGKTRCGKVLSAMPVVLSLLHYALVDYTGRIGLLGIGTTVWYGAVCYRLLQGKGIPTQFPPAAPDSQP